MNPPFSKMNEGFHSGNFFNYLSILSIVEKFSHWSNSRECIHRYDHSQSLWNDFTVRKFDTQSFFHFNHRSKSSHQIQILSVCSWIHHFQRWMRDFKMENFFNHLSTLIIDEKFDINLNSGQYLHGYRLYQTWEIDFSERKYHLQWYIYCDHRCEFSYHTQFLTMCSWIHHFQRWMRDLMVKFF